MLQVCIDDSRTEPNQGPVFVLGGYVGRVQNWEHFADDWQSALKKKPALPYLKGIEACRLTGAFFHWDPAERDARVLGFISIINKYKLRSVRCTVRHTSYRENLGNLKVNMRGRIRPLNPTLSTPGVTAIGAVTYAVLADIFKSGTLEKVRFIYDEDVVSRKELETSHHVMMSGGSDPRKIASSLIYEKPHFEKDVEFLPLQAADLYAYYAGKATCGEELDSPIWKALSALPPIEASLDDEDLAKARGKVFDALESRYPGITAGAKGKRN